MRPRRFQLLTGLPRWLLWAVVGVAALDVVTVLVSRGAGASRGGLTDGIRLGLPVVLTCAATVLLLRRVRMVPVERVLWRRMAGAALLLGVMAVAAAVLAALPLSSAVAHLPLVWAPVVAFQLVYGGLVGWNRYSTSVADPNDTINGVSAVLAVIAVVNTVLAWVGSARDEPWWELQGLLAEAAVSFVILGTALSVAFVAAMAGDPRSWLFAGGFAVQCAAAVAGVVAADWQFGWTGTAVAVACICVAACLQPPPVTPQPTDPAATTIGAFVVIICSVAALMVSIFGLHSALGVWCAGAAAAGSSVRLLLNVRDLSQLAVSRKEALTDELTGLANRRAMLRHLEEAATSGRPFIFGLLDLDKFKAINDGLGHAAGDDLLRLVAQRIEPLLSTHDLLARLGGDEFAVVAHVPTRHTPGGRALWLGKRLQSCLAEPFDLGGLSVHAPAAIGLTYTGERSGATPLTPTDLLRQADTAMYDAKRSRSAVVVFDAVRHTDNSGQLALVEELRTALVTDQLELHYQPQVDVLTGDAVGVEALVRWEHPTRGLLGPAEFLPLAEVHGLMGTLTQTVLEKAVAQAARWQREGIDLRMSVNLSVSNLLDVNLPQRVDRLLRAHGVSPASIVLEVTETVLMSDPASSVAVVTALAALGTTVSIDDFGTGYASLTYLRELPVTELKLDRSFTVDLLIDARAAMIVRSTIELAHQLGLRVVAEGVERAATLTRLRELGCDESQGYLHSRPLPADQLAGWWIHNNRAGSPVLAPLA